MSTTNSPYTTEVDNIQDLNAYISKEIGLTDWIEIQQSDINTFGQLTQDEQWIHVDVDRAKKESPFGTPVAHGFMILSYASNFVYECLKVKSVIMGVNYGLNKVRFITPIPVGSKLRARIVLDQLDIIPNGAKYFLNITFELEGQEKPCCVAEFIAQVIGG
ncbi:MaoC family dehydratase [Saprospiraceae bacterium]|nr:MaoC family dehydratase [Saprospiraceae bacterium]